jgi:hypothetical protein
MCSPTPSVVYYAKKKFLNKIGRHPSEKEEEKLVFEYSFTTVIDYVSFSQYRRSSVKGYLTSLLQFNITALSISTVHI